MDSGPIFTRRDLLKRVTMVGAAVALPANLILAQGTPAGVPETFETLTGAEAGTLQAIVARLIPTDVNGPGAAEARAALYIDRALGGALAPLRDVYRAGFGLLERYTQTSRKASFVALPPAEQDAVLRALETDAAPGFFASSVFFNLVLSHTMQGTFGDPYDGGNANFVGWDLIGYPGVRLAVAADDQRLDARPRPTHRSAYDHAMFAKKKPDAR